MSDPHLPTPTTTTANTNPRYRCASCDLGVVLIDGHAIRGCACAPTTPIVADMRAAAYGRGGVRG